MNVQILMINGNAIARNGVWAVASFMGTKPELPPTLTVVVALLPIKTVVVYVTIRPDSEIVIVASEVEVKTFVVVDVDRDDETSSCGRNGFCGGGQEAWGNDRRRLVSEKQGAAGLGLRIQMGTGVMEKYGL
jgi:hypothetical protein